VAPLTIGANATIGAGSCLTKDVPDGALALGRARQLIKENWRGPLPQTKAEPDPGDPA
jgi:bifunctional UDP-N-acetylglucosamine pyrophosphorylase/glucosamine-1-phosphate N-acetyltransferase